MVHAILFSLAYVVVTVAFEGDTMIQFVNESLLFKEVCLNISHTNLQREIVVIVSTEEGTASGNTILALCMTLYSLYTCIHSTHTFYRIN